jgi:hypothetical protein
MLDRFLNYEIVGRALELFADVVAECRKYYAGDLHRKDRKDHDRAL